MVRGFSRAAQAPVFNSWGKTGITKYCGDFKKQERVESGNSAVFTGMGVIRVVKISR
jgi:hypothetical protein